MFRRAKICSATNLALLAGVWLSLATIATGVAAGSPVSVTYHSQEKPLKMNMNSNKEIKLTLTFDKVAILEKKAEKLEIVFKTKTISPQFNILTLDGSSNRIPILRRQLELSAYTAEVTLKLYANYIGHAQVQPILLDFIDNTTKRMSTIDLTSLQQQDGNILSVTIVQDEGIWGTIFLVCVSIFMLISYINLGAQLDQENLSKIIKRPRALIVGFLISVLLMPLVAWFVCKWLIRDIIYRIGAFVFACCPAASASTLWTVMLDSDKELSVGLQVLSTVGALATMPSLLYLMDMSLKSELSSSTYNSIKVPYARLIQTLFFLLVALLIGMRFVGRNERLQKISTKIFRPLVFSVLIFIIVFSSILYWHIYQMFDLQITLASTITTITCYLVAGFLGYLINCDFDHAIAIAISSAYKNAGIAFAVLLVAFGAPDTYIAYVPCLTQIVITSILLYLVFLGKSLATRICRRGQPDVIQAEAGELGADRRNSRRDTNSGSLGGDKAAGGADDNVDDVDEFIALNVTDMVPESECQLDETGDKSPPPPLKTVA